MTEKILLMSPDCPGCKEIKKHLTRNKLLTKYKVLDVTKKEGARLANKLGINYVPSCAIIEKTKNGRIARPCSESEFREILEGK